MQYKDPSSARTGNISFSIEVGLSYRNKEKQSRQKW